MGILVLLLVFFSGSLFVPQVRNIFSSMAHQSLPSFLSLSKKLSEATPVLSFESRSSLQKENERLRELLAEQEALIADKLILEQDNARLREALGRADGGKLIVAQILSKPNRSPYDTIIADAGVSEGVAKDAVVLAYGNIPVGRVAEAYPHTSLIRLYSSPGEELQVYVGSSSIQAKAAGIGGGNFRTELPKDTPVSLGDHIIVPATRPFLLGTVEHIDTSDTETLAHIFFKSPANIYTMTKVYIRAQHEPVNQD